MEWKRIWKASKVQASGLMTWEWGVCLLVLAMLGMFLLGHDWLGIHSYLATVLALVGGLVLALFGFVFATMIMPLVGLVFGFLGSLFALVVAPLLTFVMGVIVVPLTAFVTGLLSSILAWLAGTWLGTLMMPVINMVAPFVLKFGPWLAAAKNSAWAWEQVNKLRVRFGLVALKRPLPKRARKGNARRR